MFIGKFCFHNMSVQQQVLVSIMVVIHGVHKETQTSDNQTDINNMRN